FADGRYESRAPLFGGSAAKQLRDIDHSVVPSPTDPGHAYLVTRVPVREHAHLLGIIEIAETLDMRDDFVRTSAWNTAIATLALVLVSGMVALAVGVVMVGRPLRLLANKAKRVGIGDLTGPLHLKQRDEIGELAREVNAMCEKLAEANERSALETRARLKALEQLRHADRIITVGRLAAGIAHELGTPLNVVAGRVKMLRRSRAEPPMLDEYLTIIAEQVERMALIIRQLLDFARRREPRIHTHDLVAIAGTIARLLEPIARRKSVQVTLTTTNPVLARIDAARIEQVISNLVVNAIHACAAGGHVEISCGLQNDEGELRQRIAYVKVRDDGHGMDEDTVARIFEPFFTTKDVGQGTGLGLSVAHGIVEEHGGRISVESTPGEGSVFTVYLTADERAEAS
ncbi:MAG TPA: HAMP domain-containing sensor histidine kinase, partial [Polyangiaceae bacterium]|nr:HAMP domain-containing sensor histidine kinase [Polyangiaceae bacterium]